MRKISLLFFAILFFGQTLAQKVNGIDIDALISKMTVEEKAGQMTQIDLGVIAVGDICNLKNPQQLDKVKLKRALSDYKVGSVLNVGCGSGTIAVDNWRSIISGIHAANTSYNNEVPVIYGVDAIHGANYSMGATLFPQEIGQAATWNPSLIQQLNAVTAYETRANGIPWNFSPVLDIGRQPLWSRFFETYGEDVTLASSMAKAAIIGMQGNDVNNATHVAGCMKHFLGYSFPLSGHDRTPAWISDRELREYFVPTFQTAINAGAKTIMINSGEINGTPVHANYDILTTLLRNELGFKGVAVTDWEDIYKLVNVHHVAATKKESVKMAIMAGIDMSMTPNDYEYTDCLIALIKEGSIPMSRIDASVRRILILKAELGLFKNTIYPASQYTNFGSKENSALSYRIAGESITLLKNDNSVLPLSNEGQKILVCGPAAQSLNLLNGAWTHTWQGVDDRFNTKGKLNIYEALKQNMPNNMLEYAKGASLDSLVDISDCINKALTADKIIVCLGEKPSTEIPGNINDLSLTSAQQELVNALLELKKPIILVCCFNRPQIIHSISKNVDAIIYGYLPGDEGGRAIADVINGKINPSGKLPFTYPSAVNAFMHYDHKSSEELDIDFSNNAYRPEFDFGYGLSYSTFAYSNFSVSNDTLLTYDSLMVSVLVKNTSAFQGAETVQLYYHDQVASITPSVKKLLAFKKISLQAGESQRVEFTIRAADLSFINKSLQRVTEPGMFDLLLANFKTSFYVD